MQVNILKDIKKNLQIEKLDYNKKFENFEKKFFKHNFKNDLLLEIKGQIHKNSKKLEKISNREKKTYLIQKKPKISIIPEKPLVKKEFSIKRTNSKKTNFQILPRKSTFDKNFSKKLFSDRKIATDILSRKSNFSNLIKSSFSNKLCLKKKEDQSKKNNLLILDENISRRKVSNLGMSLIKSNLSKGMKDFHIELSKKKKDRSLRKSLKKDIVFSKPKINKTKKIFEELEKTRIKKMALLIMFTLILRHSIIKTIERKKLKILDVYKIEYKKLVILLSGKIKDNLTKTLFKIWDPSKNLCFFRNKSRLNKVSKLYGKNFKKCGNLKKTTGLIYKIIYEILHNLQIKPNFDEIKKILLIIFKNKTVFHSNFFFQFEFEFVKISNFGYIKFESTDELIYVVYNFILLKIFLNLLSNPYKYFEKQYKKNSKEMNQIKINTLFICSIIQELYNISLLTNFYLSKKNNFIYRGYGYDKRKKLRIFDDFIIKDEEYKENLIFCDTLPKEFLTKFFESQKQSKDKRLEFKLEEIVNSLKFLNLQLQIIVDKN